MPIVDPFPLANIDYTGPADNAAAVVPNDATDLAYVPREIWVGTQGDLKVTTRGGQTITIPNAVGRLSLRVTRIWATGTTAAGIVVLW
ncbi:hypothetical protein FHS55_002106 [Angulomicrobium tetraedrale]|uniref:Uncharacterized protein n=1 Tax=Ancylobacter tetraedralis TaxID=217068 RepID=A0A839Z9V6_9HYPH|nr:hypothetical protein [Ancylobacter tetraedralis]MBB3771507.1 hypothetical protein [Ancylobacter tetraedralis]